MLAHFPDDSYKVSDWLPLEPVFSEDHNGEDEVSHLVISFNGIEIPIDQEEYSFLFR